MIAWQEIAIRLVLAAFFGGMIGLERERKNWAAGLRTHMMVCVGAALTMMVSAFGFTDVLGTENVTLDPSRIAAQVISGIGFIGAGTILFLRQGIVRGLTTASGLWTVAAIGLATGGGMYFAASLTTFIALIILWVLQPVEKKIFKSSKYQTVRIVLKDSKHASDIINIFVSSEKISLTTFSIDRTEDEITLQLPASTNQAALVEMVKTLEQDNNVKEISWNNDR